MPDHAPPGCVTPAYLSEPQFPRPQDRGDSTHFTAVQRLNQSSCLTTVAGAAAGKLLDERCYHYGQHPVHKKGFRTEAVRGPHHEEFDTLFS